MNASNLNSAMDGREARFYDTAGVDLPVDVNEHMLRELGIREQSLPPERIREISSFASKLREEGKRERAVKREVTRKFNITIIK